MKDIEGPRNVNGIQVVSLQVGAVVGLVQADGPVCGGLVLADIDGDGLGQVGAGERHCRCGQEEREGKVPLCRSVE